MAIGTLNQPFRMNISDILMSLSDSCTFLQKCETEEVLYLLNLSILSSFVLHRVESSDNQISLVSALV